MDDAHHTREEILTQSLQSVQAQNHNVEPCVICLDQVSEGAVANPCRHHNFDYLCLLSWLEQQRTCPLCKTPITDVEYNNPAGKRAVYQVGDGPARASSLSRSRPRRDTRGYRYRRPRTSGRDRTRGRNQSTVLTRRRDVYRYQLYSSHVGSNRVSAYQNLTPQKIAESPALISRARAWIQRELEVFSFLDHEVGEGDGQHAEPTLRNISNTFFLLEYIVAIVKTVDVKGSSGQAQDMLADYLGRENARLFLHELSSYLRSPFETPDAWDRHVQYPKSRASANRQSVGRRDIQP